MLFFANLNIIRIFAMCIAVHILFICSFATRIGTSESERALTIVKRFALDSVGFSINDSR